MIASMIPFNPSGVPAVLRQHPHWLVANATGKPVKTGSTGNSFTTPSHWADFDTVSQIASESSGLWPYLVLTEGCGITCFDVDRKPRRETETEADYKARLERADRAIENVRTMFPTRYEERSKSGNGIHIFVLGTFEGSGGKGKGEWSEVEVYTREFGIAITGETVDENTEPGTYDDGKIQSIRDMIKGGSPSDAPPPSPANGSVRPEFAREVVSEVAEKLGRPEYDDWRDVSSAVFDGVGVETGIEILSEVWPEEKEGEYDTLARSFKYFISWKTLRGHGVDPDDPQEWLRLLPDLTEEPDPGGLTLLERAYALRFDPANPPPPVELRMTLGDCPIGASGNLTVLQGKSKVGKSAVVAAILGAALRGSDEEGSEELSFPSLGIGDTLAFKWTADSGGAVIHFDTEQSRADWDGLVRRSLKRGNVGYSDRFVSFPFVAFTRAERLKLLPLVLERERREKGGIDLVVLDGVADLCKSPNDEGEGNELVSYLHALADEFRTMIVCVIHENPGTDEGKTRGHLGSELNRKAFSNLRIDKDGEAGVSTIYGTSMRKRDIPKSQGFCFAWDDAAGMHLFRGRASGVKKSHRVSKKQEEERAYFEEIAAQIAESNGTKDACPVFGVEEVRQAHRDMNGTKNLLKFEATKKRLQRAEALGVLRKTERGRWTLTEMGQMGQEWDNVA
jgi:hypothetical protein